MWFISSIEELISEYKNPTVKSQLARKKLFHTNFNEQDKSNEYIDVLKKSLITKRVDKRYRNIEFTKFIKKIFPLLLQVLR